MERNLLKEIRYLTHLIQQHKKSLEGQTTAEDNLKSYNIPGIRRNLEQSVSSKSSLQKSTHQDTNEHIKQFTSANVYINPNFKRPNSVIHVNPNVPVRPPIHINPKIMKDGNAANDKVQNSITNTTIINEKENVQKPIKQSVYVHPRLMKKLVSTNQNKTMESKIEKPIHNATNCGVQKQTLSATNTSFSTKTTSSNDTLFLSRRKLIRKRLSSISQAEMCKLKHSAIFPLRKTMIDTSKIIRNNPGTNSIIRSVKKNHNVLRSRTTKSKTTRYKIIRDVSQIQEIKRQGTLSNASSTGLIMIGGIVYRSSRNQLIRRSLPVKRKSMGVTKKSKFVITPNGKKLRRLIISKDRINQSITNTPAKTVQAEQKHGIVKVQKYNHKNIVSNKVKQKSIQILRNKMRKNNQPCLLYQKFGYCANHEKGICPKLHDKKQVSLCKRFLQGKCLLDNCQLSHDIGPEKMPTCKYFLEGCCMRETCPYRHIKVSSTTSICMEFLKGYCAKGNECKQRHEYICPEFDKSGKCSKGKYCPYPHKLHSSTTQIKNHFRQQTSDTSKSEQILNNPPASFAQESKLRYYERSDALSEDISSEKEKQQKVQLMKNVQTNDQSSGISANEQLKVVDISETDSSESDVEILSDNKLPRRFPIGSLPAYIPIN